MKNWNGFTLWVMALFLLALCGPAGAGEPPMVERHIFSPDDNAPGGKGAEKSPLVKKLERQIMFTAVIISPHGRQAMIKDRALRRGETASPVLHKEGDEVAGMTIKKIGSNFIVLAGDGKEVRLNLYQGKKKRPAPPALPRVEGSTPSQASTGKQPSLSVGSPEQPGKRSVPTKSNTLNRQRALRRTRPKAITTRKSAKAGENRRSNPFLEALKRAAQKRRDSGKQQATSANNPFLQAIKRARGE